MHTRTGFGQRYAASCSYRRYAALRSACSQLNCSTHPSVVRPGEVRVCDGCHGVNTVNQAGQPPSQNVADAFRELLHAAKDMIDPLFKDGFGG